MCSRRRWGRWVNAFKARQDAGEGVLSESERVELARLRKENQDLKLDRAFLKRASLYAGDRCQVAVLSSLLRIAA